MNYRRLGRSGLKVSELSFGSWVTYGNQVDTRAARELMAAAFDAGVNFFDNAEIYARGKSEEIMGAVLKELAWPRIKYVVSTKFFWGMASGKGEFPNERNTLNRKYLRQAIDGSLARLGLDYVDLVYCHRPDPATPIEETVWAMHDMIERGQALYWGTSEWSADEIAEAAAIAKREHIIGPTAEQPQYNMFHRERVEREYARLYDGLGLGLTIWSPLASGLLTGKYDQGAVPGTRAELPGMEWLREELLGESARPKIEKVKKLKAVADRLGCTRAQLAIAWCLKNPHVSSAITGATRREQVNENLGAMAVAERLNGEVMRDIDRILEGR